MKLYINVKQLGKRRDVISERPIQLDTTPLTVKDLIISIVRIEVARFNEQPDEETFLSYLTQKEITGQADAGKIAFGVHYNQNKAEVDEAIENALLAFQDGLFRLFLNDEEQPEASRQIQLNEGDRLTFVRLTMLAGRMW